jgi:hypothetical protein
MVIVVKRFMLQHMNDTSVYMCVFMCVCVLLIFGVLYRMMGVTFTLENELEISEKFWLPTIPI